MALCASGTTRLQACSLCFLGIQKLFDLSLVLFCCLLKFSVGHRRFGEIVGCSPFCRSCEHILSRSCVHHSSRYWVDGDGPSILDCVDAPRFGVHDRSPVVNKPESTHIPGGHAVVG